MTVTRVSWFAGAFFLAWSVAQAWAADRPIRIYEEGKDAVQISGTFIRVSDTEWKEENQEGAGVFRIVTETSDAIELISETRGVFIKLDLKEHTVNFRPDKSTPYRFLYRITKIDMSSTSAPRAAVAAPDHPVAPRSALSVSDQNAPYEMTPAQITQLQEALYNLDYKITKVDGVMGAETRSALMELQQKTGSAQTGVPTEKQFTDIVSVDFSGAIWGAVAATPIGDYGSAWNYSTRRAAHDAALNGCRKRASNPEDCASIEGFSQPQGGRKQQWFAVVHCNRQDQSRIYDVGAKASDPTKQATIDDAFSLGESHGYIRSQCGLVTVFSSDGSQ